MTGAAAADPAAWGIAHGYWDTGGTWHTPPTETFESLLAAMHAGDHPDGPPDPPPMWLVRAGDTPELMSPADVVLEDGTWLCLDDALPPDLPLGYHELFPLDGGPITTLVITPGRCHLPEPLRTWGWALQVYAARSRRSWGIGDLGDVRRVAEWSSRLGAGVLALSPLHAPAPTVPQQASPYYPCSRRWRNPLHLRVEEVPGADEADVDLEALARAGTALNTSRHIDRDEVFRLKWDALAVLWDRFRGDAGFDAWRDEHKGPLHTFATFCALAERHGTGYSQWPWEYRHPGSAAVARFAADNEDSVIFHAWLQWLLDLQLDSAGSASDVTLLQDLAVGFDPDGADAWEWQDLLAAGVRIGAPPDDFNTQGQDWGLPPFVPWRLRQSRYRPFVETVRAGFRHAGGLRIDHVMGLFRLFWIPPDAGATAGTYVRYPAGDLLDILALESVRAGAFVVGEDLGTVEDEARDELARRSVLSYRLFWFEPEPPVRWRRDALCAVTTHDLPTIAGVWTGEDLDAQRLLDMKPNEEGTNEMRRKLAEVAEVAGGSEVPSVSVDEVVVATYRSIAEAPCGVVIGTLDDALGVTERPNMPGTVDQWPNWSIALPLPLDEIEGHPVVLAVASVLAERRR